MKLFSAIDIGSHELKMKIVEITKDNQIRDLETVNKLIPLGRDTFNYGRLSFESVGKTCDSIVDFKRLMGDYRVKNYKVVATSAVREASNRDYMIDQIRLKTGFDIEIINNSQEKFLTYLAIKKTMHQNDKDLCGDNTLIVDIGAGSIQLSVCKDCLIVSSESVKLGALRIREILASLEKHTLNFTKVLEEYIEAHIESLDYINNQKGIKNFIVVGGEIDYIYKISGADEIINGRKPLTRSSFNKIYNSLIKKSPELITAEYGIPYRDADILVPSFILIKKFMDKTDSDRMIIPRVSLVDGLVLEHIGEKESGAGGMLCEEDIISYAKVLAAKYKYNHTHSHYVEETALKIFDCIRRIHGLKRERILLQVAAILHDTGKYIGADPHYEYSQSIILASKLIGFSDQELSIIGNVARYHSTEEPSYYSSSLRKLSTKDRIIASKLIAIIRLADALDTSHKQKLKNIKLLLKGKEFIIRAETIEEILLEQWTFESKAEFFEEVFGIKPKLKIVNKML